MEILNTIISGIGLILSAIVLVLVLKLYKNK